MNFNNLLKIYEARAKSEPTKEVQEFDIKDKVVAVLKSLLYNDHQNKRIQEASRTLNNKMKKHIIFLLLLTITTFLSAQSSWVTILPGDGIPKKMIPTNDGG